MGRWFQVSLFALSGDEVCGLSEAHIKRSYEVRHYLANKIESTSNTENKPKSSSIKASLEIFAIQGFPFLLIANAAAFMGFQVRNMGQSWLVLELTDSSFLVGLVNAMPAMALLVLSPIGGVIADRYDRRLVALYGRLIVAIISYFVAFLVGSGTIEWWHLMVTGVLIGIAFALSNPASQTIVMDVVGRERMVAAQSLNTTVSNLGNMIGPAIGGILVAAYGNASVFWLIAGIYTVGSIGFIGVKTKITPSVQGGWRSGFEQMSQGMRYSWNTSQIRWLLIMTMGVIFWGILQPVLPIYARDILEVGASGFGFISAAWGAGALVAALAVFVLGGMPKKGLMSILSVFVMAIGHSVFAASTNYSISLIAIFVSGAAGGIWMTSVFALLQMAVADEMRGRVMGLAMSSLMMMGFGLVLGGTIADLLSPALALYISAIGWSSLAGLAYWRSSELRSLD